MRLAMPFDPNEIGEIDAFAFDFTAGMGAATMVSTNWTCGVAAFQTATDPVPQSRYFGLDPDSNSVAHPDRWVAADAYSVLLSHLDRRHADHGGRRLLCPRSLGCPKRRPSAQAQRYSPVQTPGSVTVRETRL
jgi:hypothetical protein